MNKIQQDFAFLEKHQANGFQHVSIDEVCELMEHKRLYKKSCKEDPLYSLFKEKMQLLRRQKLPFRLIEIVKTCFRERKRLPESMEENGLFGDYPAKADKKYYSSLEQRFVEAFKQKKEDFLSLAETVTYLHGTNSAVFALLPNTELTLLPTGTLLDRGFAPMGGELDRGVAANGYNQEWLSVETIRDIDRILTYATSISNSFDAKVYEDAETFFLDKLNLLDNLNPTDDKWDSVIISLNRLKQWHTDIFIQLCSKYAEKIEAIKNRAKSTCARNEMDVLKALEYDLDKIDAAAEGNEKAQQEIYEDFKRHFENEEHSICFMGSIVEKSEEHALFLFYLLFHSNKLFDESRFYYEYSCVVYLVLKIRYQRECGERVLAMIKGWANGSVPITEEEYRKKYDDNRSLDSYIQIGSALVREFGTTISFADLLDAHVRPKIEARITKLMRPFKRRYQRLETLFSAPTISLSMAEKVMILEPFPIVMASTTQKSVSITTNQEEYQVRKAALGDDINLMFIQDENRQAVSTWLEKHDLETKISLFSLSTLKELAELPLYHAPLQVMSEEKYLNETHYSSIQKILNEHVLPLYQVPYPSGEKREIHGVPHAFGTAFFAAIISEMYFEAGHRFTETKGDLLISMSLHDVAREDDGPDLWDEKSGEVAQDLFTKLGRDKESSEKGGRIIAEKDAETTFCLEQRVVHDGDCIEIHRPPCLRNPEDFKPSELWMFEDIHPQIVTSFIEEAKLFIAMRETFAIKAFIETSADPFALYFQILSFAHKEGGAFPLLAQYGRWGMRAFADASTYLLNSEIEEELLQCLGK